MLNLDDGLWTNLPPLSTPRGGLALAYDSLAVFALGGGWTYPIRTFERYDPTTNTWSNFPSPIQGEWRHLGAAAKDERLPGGQLGGAVSGHAYLQYQKSTFRALLPVINKLSRMPNPRIAQSDETKNGSVVDGPAGCQRPERA
ncbi:MAG: hypothetical protein R2854_15965 [Caldilineaceae bacterium]